MRLRVHAVLGLFEPLRVYSPQGGRKVLFLKLSGGAKASLTHKSGGAKASLTHKSGSNQRTQRRTNEAPT
jgi:hypothetical protein